MPEFFIGAMVAWCLGLWAIGRLGEYLAARRRTGEQRDYRDDLFGDGDGIYLPPPTKVERQINRIVRKRWTA